mgnify:CR=1 FL=1
MGKVMVMHVVPSGGSPPPGGNTYLTNPNSILQVPTLPLIGRGETYIDPVFGGTVTKISDIDDEPAGCYMNRHEYSKYPGVNSDGTRIMTMLSGRSSLGYPYSGYKSVRSTENGTVIGSRIADGVDSEFMWHPTNPTLGYYRYGRQYKQFNATTGATTNLASLTRSDGSNYYVCYTHGEGRPSDDLRWWACYGVYTSSYTTRDFLVVDLQDGSIRARVEPMPSPYGDAVSMSPLGNYVMKLSDATGENELYDKDLNYIRRLFYDACHGDFVLGSDGYEYYVGQITSGRALTEMGGESGYPNDIITAYRLVDTTIIKVLRSHWNLSFHISGIISRAHPGWCVVSTYSSSQSSVAASSYWETLHPLQHEIFLLNIHTGEIRRICHHHSLADRSATGEDKDYFAEPQATSSWDGDSVVFSSNWGPSERYTRYETYKIEGTFW